MGRGAERKKLFKVIKNKVNIIFLKIKIRLKVRLIKLILLLLLFV